jgi:hypothetical protein
MNGTVRTASFKSEIIAYFAILAMAGLQIIVAYRRGSVGQHIIEMLSLSIGQAAVGVLFFMHLLQEKRSLMYVLIPAVLFVFLLMNAFWTDSFRMVQMRPWAN